MRGTLGWQWAASIAPLYSTNVPPHSGKAITAHRRIDAPFLPSYQTLLLILAVGRLACTGDVMYERSTGQSQGAIIYRLHRVVPCIKQYTVSDLRQELRTYRHSDEGCYYVRVVVYLANARVNILLGVRVTAVPHLSRQTGWGAPSIKLYKSRDERQRHRTFRGDPI